MKIIYITSHNPAYELIDEMPEPDIKFDLKNNAWFGIWRGDWGDKLGSLIKENYPEVEFECWQPDSRADKIYEYRFEDEILHKRFPAKKKRYFYGTKIYREVYSKLLMNELSNLEKNKTIVHLGADYNYFGAKIHSILYKKVPVISWFLLNISLNNPVYENTNIFQKLHRHLINKTIRKHLTYIRYPIVLNDYSKEVISRLTGRNVYVMPWAIIDFNFWKCDMDKIELRRKFNIPSEEKVFFSSSRIVESKQIDKLIEIFTEFNNYDFKLFISGAGPVDYINYIKGLIKNQLKDKIILLGYVDEILLKKYYILSDYFISGSLMEGGPTSGLYALALEKKMIVTDTGYVADALKEFNSGMILPTTGYDEWKSEIKKVLGGKEIKVIEREKIQKKFDTIQYSSNMMDIYKKALSDFKRE